MLFTAERVSKRFGQFQALKEVSFDVDQGGILGIAGPNGAGKSTLLNVCSGTLKPSGGTIILDGQRTDGLPLRRMAEAGLARTFQIPQVFGSVNIDTNIRIGATFGRKRAADEVQDRVERVINLLDLHATRYRLAGQADLLTRKMTMLGAALATDPKIVFMDEPFGGLNTEEIQGYIDLIQRLRQDLELAFVIVEHKMRALTTLSDRLMILNFGEMLFEGTPEEVLSNKQVNEIYLGRREDSAVH